MSETRAADDFVTIRARLEELRRKRERAKTDLRSEPSTRPGGRPGPVAISIRRLRNAAG